jgi:hypothetical protein
MYRLPFTPRKIPGTLSVRDWVNPRAIVRLEGLGQMKNQKTSSEMEPKIFQLVAYINKAI